MNEAVQKNLKRLYSFRYPSRLVRGFFCPVAGQEPHSALGVAARAGYVVTKNELVRTYEKSK